MTGVDRGRYGPVRHHRTVDAGTVRLDRNCAQTGPHNAPLPQPGAGTRVAVYAAAGRRQREHRVSAISPGFFPSRVNCFL